MPDTVTLPKTFDEYNDTRKANFMRVKEFKEGGGRLAGYLCSYAPLEVLDAAGVSSVGLCGTSDETVEAAETVLPRGLCPLIKSTYGFALTDKCPYTYFSDLIIGETTCDGKKKMYELLDDIKHTYVLRLPNGHDRAYEFDAWYDEVKLFKEHIEELLGVEVTEEKLRDAARKRNRLRQAVIDQAELQVSEPPMTWGCEIMSSALAGTFYFDCGEYAASLERSVAEHKAAYEAGERPVPSTAKRIMITGCPTGGVIRKIGEVIEKSGGVIVCNDSCNGERTSRMMIDPEAPDILRVLSDRYLKINCAVMTPNEGRLDSVRDLCEKYRVAGVIDNVLTGCHPFNVEGSLVERLCDGMGMPYMKLETDYSDGDSGQLSTRIAAFIEML
ncbi:MAG: double-cubane-cluster-containing anaerobic reductase [Olsenella profusa]